MHEPIVDALARRAGRSQDRRRSLTALGFAALATSGIPLLTTAKGKKKGKKACKKQVAGCKQSLNRLCDGMGTQLCFDSVDRCCGLLAECDARAAMDCVVEAFLD